MKMKMLDAQFPWDSGLPLTGLEFKRCGPNETLSQKTTTNKKSRLELSLKLKNIVG